MELEMRHTEKSIPFQLFRAKETGDVDLVISQLIATMEPEDVELVKKQIDDLKKK